MAKRAKVQGRLYLGLSIAAVMSFAASSIPFRLAANDHTDTVDPTVTGGIAPIPAIRSIAPPPAAPAEPAAAIAPVASVEELTVEELAEPKGSDAFRAALELIADGEEVDAFAAAKDLDDDLERRTIEWAAYYFGGDDLPYAAIEAFKTDAPLFATDEIYQARLEAALVGADPPAADVIRLLGGQMPTSAGAKIALAMAYLAGGQEERATSLAKVIWTEEFLDASTERKVLNELGGLLTAEDHWSRAMHLMMHDRASATERLFRFLTEGQKELARARNATSRGAKNGKSLLDALPEEWQDHPIYVYTRVQRAAASGLYESAVDWLDKATGDLPDSAEWWYERRAIVRKLLEAGEEKLAYRAAAGYTQGPDGRVVEANFHAGYIALSFLDDAATAETHFVEMTKHSTLPESVAQANYWLGRARLALGKDEAAKDAFIAAAAYPTIYYGQLSRLALGLTSADLRTMPNAAGSQTAFEALEVIRAIRLLAANGEAEMAIPLLRDFAPTLDTGAEFLLAARLAQSLGAYNLAIVIAEDAEERGMPLDLFSFPEDGLPADVQLAAVDKAAVYAITRQESRFQIDAVSSAGAQGLMQLMPGTAKETARKIGLAYSKSRLTTDPSYNALLGSTYLAAQLQRYEGSLVLAAAAYNAGPGNANKWIRLFGDPRSASVDPIVWVELIPLEETRKYVKRVLGNYVVYRARLGDEEISIEDALRRIPG
jgi:soluble lytic murein transglycosylase